jgi:hypothetical protein
LLAVAVAGVLFVLAVAPRRVNILEKSLAGWLFPFNAFERPTKTTPSSIARRLFEFAGESQRAFEFAVGSQDRRRAGSGGQPGAGSIGWNGGALGVVDKGGHK